MRNLNFELKLMCRRNRDGSYATQRDRERVLEQQASIRRGRGRPVVAVKRPTLNMRVDPDVLEAFKATGQGWQTRINAALRDAVSRGIAKA